MILICKHTSLLKKCKDLTDKRLGIFPDCAEKMRFAFGEQPSQRFVFHNTLSGYPGGVLIMNASDDFSVYYAKLRKGATIA